jgi:hypothetical protein
MFEEIILLRLEAAARCLNEVGPMTRSRFVPICPVIELRHSRAAGKHV